MCCNSFNRCCQRPFFPSQTIIFRPITPVNGPTINVLPALYAGNTSIDVNENEIIPLSVITQTPSSGITFSDNAAIVPSGTYSVSFGFTVEENTENEGAQNNDNTNTITVSLYLNGSPVYGETISSNGSNSVSKTILKSLNTGDMLSLQNISNCSVTFANVFLTIVKIA